MQSEKAQVNSIHEAESSDESKDGGLNRSSEEVSVMEMERRVQLIHLH